MSDRKPNKPGEGVIFPNNAANPHPKAPGQRGRMTCPVCKAVLLISGWVNTSRSTGIKYLRLALEQEVPTSEEAPNDAAPY